MRPARHHGQLKWITEISVTPLLDLVFILLFAFMVALPLISRTDSLLSKPSPATSSTRAVPTPAPENTLTLVLLPSDSVSWNETEIPLSALETRLRAAVLARPQLAVILEMSPELPVARLVTPMATLLNAGVQSTAIRLAPAPQ